MTTKAKTDINPDGEQAEQYAPYEVAEHSPSQPSASRGAFTPVRAAIMDGWGVAVSTEVACPFPPRGKVRMGALALPESKAALDTQV